MRLLFVTGIQVSVMHSRYPRPGTRIYLEQLGQICACQLCSPDSTTSPSCTIPGTFSSSIANKFLAILDFIASTTGVLGMSSNPILEKSVECLLAASQVHPHSST